MIELNESSDGILSIQVSTEKIYGVTGNQILYSISTNNNTIKIHFKKINEVGILTALGPATTTINLSDLKKDKYHIKFKLNSITTNGELSINPLKLTLKNEINIKVK